MSTIRRITFSGRLGELNNGAGRRQIVGKGLLYMALDISITLVVAISLFYTFVKSAVAPYEHDFPCGDEGIRKPFLPNTVGLKHLLVISLGSPFPLILLVEGIIFYFSTGNNRLAKFFTTSTLVYLKFLLLYAMCTFSMEFFKCYFGRMRPHFVAACRPDWTKMDCSTDPTAVIPASEVVCTNPDLHRVRVARTSFPSGHTAAAVFVWLFYTLYLIRWTLSFILHSTKQFRLADATRIPLIRWIRNAAVPFITIWSTICAISRITDCWHHPTDVLGGAILALVCFVPFYWSSWTTPEKVYAPRRIEKQRPHFE